MGEQPLPEPFVVFVHDTGGNPVEGVPVAFEALLGGGSFAGQTSIISTTDSDGRAAAVLTLGPQEGINNNVVNATFPGLAELPAVFTASGLFPGNAEDTSVSGVVLDNSNNPIPGATARILGTTLEAVTGDQGQFTISGAPVGAISLEVDGTTTTLPGTWPMLHFEFTTVSGHDNTIGMPIFLLPLDTANAKVVGGPQDVTLEMANVPGLALTVFASSVICLDGSSQCEAMITQVHRDKVPMPPSGGAAPRLVWTIQPAGILFDPPAQITYPNVSGLPLGQVVDIFSFDHDLGEFVGIGTGTVREDGSVITSDPGVGIRKAGWGFPATPPPPPNCAENVKVKITSAPDFVGVGKDEAIQAEGSLDSSPQGCPSPGGTYAWSSSDTSVVTVSGTGSTATLTGVSGGKATINVEYTADGKTATDEIEVAVPTKDVVVIAWMNPGLINLDALASEANILLKTRLNTPLLCSELLLEWLGGFRGNVSTDADRRYANAFLLKKSPNQRPPVTIDPDAEQSRGDYRLFNRFQVVIRSGDGTPEVNTLKSSAIVGKTPDPCELVAAAEGEDHASNHANGLTQSITGVFQLNEGRIGSLGQRIDLTLNDCDSIAGFCTNIFVDVGKTTPWIWSVIRFDLEGNRSALDHQIFPTYFVYEDNQLVEQFPQSDAETFIDLDENSQRQTNDIP